MNMAWASSCKHTLHSILSGISSPLLAPADSEAGWGAGSHGGGIGWGDGEEGGGVRGSWGALFSSAGSRGGNSIPEIIAIIHQNWNPSKNVRDCLIYMGSI